MKPFGYYSRMTLCAAAVPDLFVGVFGRIFTHIDVSIELFLFDAPFEVAIRGLPLLSTITLNKFVETLTWIEKVSGDCVRATIAMPELLVHCLNSVRSAFIVGKSVEKTLVKDF